MVLPVTSNPSEIVRITTPFVVDEPTGVLDGPSAGFSTYVASSKAESLASLRWRRRWSTTHVASTPAMTIARTQNTTQNAKLCCRASELVVLSPLPAGLPPVVPEVGLNGGFVIITGGDGKPGVACVMLVGSDSAVDVAVLDVVWSDSAVNVDMLDVVWSDLGVNVDVLALDIVVDDDVVVVDAAVMWLAFWQRKPSPVQPARHLQV